MVRRNRRDALIWAILAGLTWGVVYLATIILVVTAQGGIMDTGR